MRHRPTLPRTRALVLVAALAMSLPGGVEHVGPGSTPSTPMAGPAVRSPAGPPAAPASGVDRTTATTAPTRDAMRADADLWLPVTVWTRAGGSRAVGIADVAPGPDRVARLDAVRAAAVRVLAGLDAAAPFPWREAVTRVDIGCMAVGAYLCPGGVARGDELVVSPAALGWTDDELAYVLRHELAHVWQFASGDPEARRTDLAGLEAQLGGVDPLEAAADCLAEAWGSPNLGDGYLDCPAEGVARMAEVVGLAMGPAVRDLDGPVVGRGMAASVA